MSAFDSYLQTHNIYIMRAVGGAAVRDPDNPYGGTQADGSQTPTTIAIRGQFRREASRIQNQDGSYSLCKGLLLVPAGVELLMTDKIRIDSDPTVFVILRWDSAETPHGVVQMQQVYLG